MTNRMSAQAATEAIGTPPSPGRFEVVGRDSPSRRSLEATIHSAFDRHFGARVVSFMPCLLKYEHAAGTAALGFRPAAEGPLYLETYLDAPIELFLGNILRSPVSRRDIVEVGQFAVDDRASAAAMFAELAPFLRGRGHAWIAFTATRTIRRLLERTGLRGLTIATAREDAVRHKPDAWGSYYSDDPQVVVGSLRDPGGSWCSGLPNRGRMLTAL